MDNLTKPTDKFLAVISESGLEPNTSENLKAAFMPFFEQAADWAEKAQAIKVTDATQVSLMKQAKEARLLLKKVRVDCDKTRKTLKEDSLRYGKAVQGIYNVIEGIITPIEDYLEKQEKFAEIKEREMKDVLENERKAQLSQYGSSGEFYDLRNMPQNAFDELLTNIKKVHEEKLAAAAKEEADRIEQERIAEEKRQEIIKENERLRAEAEERERVIAEERKKAEEERKAAEEKARKEREEIEAKAKAERIAAEKEAARIKAEQEAKIKEAEERLRAEEKARKKYQEELDALRQAEEKAAAEEAAAKEAQLTKGDKQRFADFMAELNMLTRKAPFKSAKYSKLYSAAVELINKTLTYLNEKIPS